MRHSNRRLVLGLMAALILAAGATVVAETAAGGLTITEIVMASSMREGVPETTTTSFSRSQGWIYCFMRLENPSGGGNEILVSFEPATGGEPTVQVTGTRLRIPARRRYRTVARTGSDMPVGQYRCVVRDREGAVLRHTPFEITE